MSDEVKGPESDTSPKDDFDGLTFEEAPSEKPVRVKLKDGSFKNYVLKEMNGDGLTAWMTIVSSRTKRNRKGMPVGAIDFSKFHASLIALCLYDAETNQRVSKEVVSGWKSSTQNSLFNECRLMNGLDDESEEKEKND